MPAKYFGSNLVFRQFHRVKSPESVKLFKFALKSLPMIETSQDLVSLIDKEVQHMTLAKQSEVTK